MKRIAHPAARFLLIMTAALFALSCSSSGSGITEQRFDERFWRQWGDGKAELTSYRLRIPRYGEIREGVAVSIFVTEPFSLREMVKAEQPKEGDPQIVQVLKHNLVQDFQTGIYDYNLMTSSFVTVQRSPNRTEGIPLKAAFSSQEWCGHTFHQLLFENDAVRQQIHSYFEGETTYPDALPYPADGLSEDLLFHWARGFAAPYLKPGEERDAQLLTGLMRARLSHLPLRWSTVRLRRGAAPEPFTFGEHTVDAERYEVALPDGERWIFLVEAAEPKKILSWESGSGYSGTIVASTRLPYWELNNPASESMLEKLRLGVSPAPLK